MRKSARLHERLAGHLPRGPFKHYWGWDSRLVGKDKPFSLFLASGIPFEVIEDLSPDGWVFLSNEDTKAVEEGRIDVKGRNLVVRNEAGVKGSNFIPIAENLADIFAFKKRIVSSLKGIPYADGESPVVFAWYPTARSALLWNVEEKTNTYKIIRDGQILRTLSLNGLDVTLIADL